MISRLSPTKSSYVERTYQRDVSTPIQKPLDLSKAKLVKKADIHLRKTQEATTKILAKPVLTSDDLERLFH